MTSHNLYFETVKNNMSDKPKKKAVGVFSKEYFEVDKKMGISPFQIMIAYLGGSAFQTVIDNPVTVSERFVGFKLFPISWGCSRYY